MPLIGFKKEFAASVLRGEKRQTVRATRKFPIKKGDKLYIYAGLRTKYCKKLREAICKDVRPITVSQTADTGCCINLAGALLNTKDTIELAKRDGFRCPRDFFQFLEKQHGLPFTGFVIRW